MLVPREQQTWSPGSPLATIPPAKPRTPDLPGVRADALTAEQKRIVWAHIQAHEPEVLAFVTDPEVKALCARMGGVPYFDAAMVKRALGGTP